MIIFGVFLPNAEAFHYHLDGRTSDDRHGHDDVHQISLPLIGRPAVMHGTERRDLSGEVRLVTSPGQRHQNFAGDDPTRLLVLNLRASMVDDLYREQTGHDQPVEFAAWSDGSSAAIRRHAEWMLRQWVQAPGAVMETEQWELELARLLLTLHAGSHGERWRASRLAPDHPALRRALGRIHDDFGQELSLDDLAGTAGVSKAHLIRLCHEHLGKTPAQYLAEVRLGHALHLLTSTARSVTEIAFASGFGSLSMFERAFKQRYGASAGAYRRELRS